MALTVVLSVGLDSELLGSRSLVLQSAGYIVVSAYSIKEAVDRFQEGDFDLVLLCHSIPSKEIDRLICWIRASGSRIPVVSISGSLDQGDAFAGMAVSSDPGTLLQEIRKVSIGTEVSAARTAASRGKQKAAAQGKTPPSSHGRKQQTKTAGGRLVPLVRAG